MRISEYQYYGTSILKQFLKNEKMKPKLRKSLTKNYSSLNQSHDGWLQNTLVILIINVAIFLSCRLMLQIFSLHKSILILGQLRFHDIFLPFSSYCIFELIFYKYLQNNRNCCFNSVPDPFNGQTVNFILKPPKVIESRTYVKKANLEHYWNNTVLLSC